MLQKFRIAAVSLLVSGFLIPAASALDAKLEVVAEGLTAPLILVSPPGDDRKFIVEQIGTIRILGADGKLRDEPFLDIQEKIVDLWHFFDEQGLLGLAFHPDYANNGKFYVSYSGPVRGDAPTAAHLWYAHTNYVAEYQVSQNDPNRADDTTERIISKEDWPQFNHNGHWIGFGPDGYLYISMGDGGYANDWGIGHNVTIGNGQDLETRKGKILRVDVNKGDDFPDDSTRNYAIPSDNPFVGRDDVLPEIWASGLRNPWRCSFDTGGTNELFCADVGQNSFEEVDIVTKGGNYGWRVKEGTHCFDYVNPNAHLASCKDSGMTDPIVEYNNCNVTADCKGLSVTGGYVYRGGHAPWSGKYIFGDWSTSFAAKDGHLFAASKSGGSWTMEDVNVTNMPEFNSYVLGFGQDAAGEVYVTVSDTRGPVGGLDRVYKIVP